MARTARLELRLEAADYMRLKKAARKLKVSLSEFVRRAAGESAIWHLSPAPTPDPLEEQEQQSTTRAALG